MPRIPRAVLPLLVLLAAIACPALAQIAMPAGVALSPFAVQQSPLTAFAFTDGVGGAWAVFQGAGTNNGLWVNHINTDGSYGPRFNAAARMISLANTSVNNVSCAPDGVGGAVICWFGASPRNPASPFIALRYLHVSYEGTIDTPDTGIVVSSIATAATCIGDGVGGGYVAFEELRTTSNPDIVAQRYNSAGVPQWTPINSATGRNLCPVVGLQRIRAIQDDGAGGVYVVWSDSRTTGTTPLYTTRVLPNGTLPWTSTGVRITPVSSGVRIVGSARSSSNGLWVVWRDVNSPTSILTQHVLDNGTLAWSALGNPVASVPSAPSRADVMSGPSGDLMITWGGTDVRGMRIDASGNRAWAESAGRLLATPAGVIGNLRSSPDGKGGQRLMWSYDNAGQNDMAIGSVDSTGTPVGGATAAGTVVENDTVSEDAIAWVSSTSDDPMLVWLEAGVERARKLGTGTTGVGPSTARGGVSLAAPWPNPIRGASLSLAFQAPAGEARLEVFDVTGRRMLAHTLASSGGAQRITLPIGTAWAPGLYTVRLDAAGVTVMRRIVRTR